MTHASKLTNAQWTVEKTGQSEDGENTYKLCEIETGVTEKISVDVDSSVQIGKLIKDKLDLLKRLADR